MYTDLTKKKVHCATPLSELMGSLYLYHKVEGRGLGESVFMEHGVRGRRRWLSLAARLGFGACISTLPCHLPGARWAGPCESQSWLFFN